MLQPIRTATYKFQDVPLTEHEKRRAKKIGQPVENVKGVFRYTGMKGGNPKRRVLVFRENATVEDGVVFKGRTIAMTVDDFSIGLDLGKIKGRAQQPRKRKAA